MGYIIGQDLPTWRATREIAIGTGVPPAPAPVSGDYNIEWPAYAGYLKTIEGNGLLRIAPPVTNPNEFLFTQNTPPIDDFFYAPAFVDPYPEQLLGKTVTTAGSTFTLTAAMFTTGDTAGSGGSPPIVVELFEAIT